MALATLDVRGDARGGGTNAATSLAVAQRHGSPVLMLAGDAPLGDTHNPQWFDQAALGRITTMSTGRLESARHLDDVLAAAFGAVRRGHAHLLNLPADVPPPTRARAGPPDSTNAITIGHNLVT